jgi:hypothetical protein
MLERGVYKFIEEGDSGYQLFLIKMGFLKGHMEQLDHFISIQCTA